LIDLCDIRKLLLDLKHIEEKIEEKTGLSLNEALCLCGTSRGTCEPGRLAKEMEISPSRLSRILESLENQKLIDRNLSSGDRRSILIALTTAGEKIVETLHCTEIEIPKHLALALDSIHDDQKTGEK
jgi:DNA-binding MarR family transcriptional regulator